MSQPEKVLEFGEPDSRNGGNLPITIEEKTGADNQKFDCTRLDMESYTFEGKGTGRYLRVYSTPNTQHAWVMLMEPAANKTDRIEIEECSETIRSSMTYTADQSQVASVTDSRGNVTTNTYDAAGRLLTAVTDAAGGTVNYTYDANTDALTGVTQQTANGTASVAYTYTDDRLTAIAHNGFQYGFTYDAFGNKLQTTAAGQVLSSNTYLAHNGLLSESTYGTGQKVGFTYDKYGRTIAKSYNGTEAFRNEYDSGGNLLRHLDLQNEVTYRYEYDLIGRLTGMRSSTGQELQVHYDDKNRVDYNLSRVNGNLVKTKYSYTDLATSGNNTRRAGQISQITVNNTCVSDYTYDTLGRVTQTRLYTGGTNQSYRTEYGYLPGAGPKDTTTLVNHVKRGNVSYDYTYDAAGNILTVTENGELKISYRYDELNQLVREDNTYLGVTKTYTYDLAGNLLQKKEYTGAQHGVETLGTPAETISYSYPSTGWKDQLAGYNGQSITYDQIGNPLSYWNGMGFTWANGRQLTGIANGSHTVSYQYDSNSIRTKKTVDGVTTEYFLNGSTVLTQVTGDTQLDFFYDDLGNALGFIRNSTDKYYYIRNLQNDVVGILDASGTQVVEYVYDTWGKLEGVTGTMAATIGRENPLRYRGYYYDEETGFYYLQSRYYDPEIGRFINADGMVQTPTGTLQSTNMYAYCENNPVSFGDSTGIWKQVSGGWQAQRGDTLWGLAVQLYGNGSKWTSFGFSRDPRTLQVGEVIKRGGMSGSKSSGSGNGGGPISIIRDVTREVNNALKPYITMARDIGRLANAMPLYESYRYGIFGMLVNHGAAWDIKRKGPWESTIGTTFPGYGALLSYGGMLMTPENLGNFTYGYLGAAFGISYQTLIYGSVGAAGLPKVGADVFNEVGDWDYIALGHLSYCIKGGA